MFIAFNIVSEHSNNKTLRKNLENTLTKTDVTVVAAAVDTTMEKLLHRIQKAPIYTVGQPSPPSAQYSDQKPPHTPLLSGAWAHALPSVHLTAHPIHLYASSPIQPFHPSGHPQPHGPPIVVRQKPSKLSNLYSNANLSVDPLRQSFFYGNGADQLHNRSGIEASESLAPSGLGQPYVCGPAINQTYNRVVFEVGASSKSINLLMYSKNPVTSLPNVPYNYITNSVALSAQFSTHNNEKNSGKPSLVCEHCKKQWHTKDQCWKLPGRPPRGNKSSSNKHSGRTDVREIANTY